MAEVVIVGGGAAGMAAAIEAARCEDRVVVLERMDRVGKKLLATGNGRCNLMNVDEQRYPGGAAFAKQVLAACGVQEQQAFWRELGLHLRTEDGGRVYPVSSQASTVLDTLRLAMERSGVRVINGVHVEAIHQTKNGFTIHAGEERFKAQRVIVAGGGCAQPKLGSDGSCFELLTSMGHRLIKPQPCLTQIQTETAAIKGLAGIRVKCRVQVVHQGKICCEEAGEALFADYGMSGVCVMQCARYVQPGSLLVLNLLEGMGFADAKDMKHELLWRKNAWKDQPMEMLLTGFCVPRLSSALCNAAGIHWKNRLISSLTPSEADRLAKLTGAFELQTKGIKGFDAAQVTRGGIAWEEFDPVTLESRLIPGLHAAGEVLNVDGDCGGFNLMFAFGSGILAGRNGRASKDRSKV